MPRDNRIANDDEVNPPPPPDDPADCSIRIDLCYYDESPPDQDDQHWDRLRDILYDLCEALPPPPRHG